MFVYRLSEPIDFFDGLTPLNEWLSDRQQPSRTAWALQAVLALTDATDQVGWRGDMRHLPMVGGLPTLSHTTPYLIIKQNDNGDTFIVSDAKIGEIDRQALVAEVPRRAVGAWTPNEDNADDEPAF